MSENSKRSNARDEVREQVSPSEFMRTRRPECYSDTEACTEYALDRPTLEYHLKSLTSRNETHDFEIFCRKLCQRTICPNLRPHSGPEGGGDGKTDSETVPVAEEVSDLFYIGDANARRSKLAFAFSAKERWTNKVRSDVEAIAGTQRGFDRIYFVTNQFARAKIVADLEKQLEAKHGIPVTILDRSWIVEQIVDHDRKDIAYNYLGVGQANSDPHRLGSMDYSRSKQLADIERQIDDHSAFAGMESQRVTEALLAAKLSRSLERPRVETDGRFARAIRLAKRSGTYRQKLETQYEAFWTSFWWFDDFRHLNDGYDDFAVQAIDASHIRNLEFLTNLLQLLFNAVIHDGLKREESKLDARAADVQKALQAMADEVDRPNNSLEAQVSLILIKLNFAVVYRNHENLPEIWRSLGDVLDRADGLGEFPAKRVAKLIEEMGNVAGNDPSYNDLIERLAEFIGIRESEASGGLMLLKRAEKLDLDNHFDIIRFAGRAASRLTKKEHTGALVCALQLLTVAYRHAGLLWVARASCAFVASSILVEAEEDGRPSVSFIPTLKIWAWLSLELGHLPDALFTIQLLNGALAILPLTDESKGKVEEDLQELDHALGALLLNAKDHALSKLQTLPDLLGDLGLVVARTALLYLLGHENILREEGSIPPDESKENAREMMSMLASQPVVEQSASEFIFNDGPQTIVTRILGMRIDIRTDGADNSSLVGELIATSLEAFFATTAEQEIIAHAASFAVSVIVRGDVDAPTFDVNEFGTSGTLTWPITMAPYAFSNQIAVRRSMSEVATKVLAHGFMASNLESILEQLNSEDAVQGRMAMALASGNSYHRVSNRFSTSLATWSEHDFDTFPIGIRPMLDKVDLSKFNAKDDAAGKKAIRNGRLRLDDHRDIEVRSIIDVHAWNQAAWRGTGYIHFAANQPPAVGLLFEGEKAARHIFCQWRSRFGKVDREHEIHIAIIRNHNPDQPSHYIMQIAAKPPHADEIKPGRSFVLACRCIENTPPDNTNVDLFLNRLAEYACYWLMPAIVKPGMVGEPDLLTDLAILKRNLSVKRASDIGETDVEAMALQQVLSRTGTGGSRSDDAS